MKTTDPAYPKPSSPHVTKVMKSNKRSNTRPETILRSKLHSLGYRFRKDQQVLVRARKCRPDIVFSKKKLAIFIDGCFWHRCPKHSHIPNVNRPYWKEKFIRNVNRDRKDSMALRSGGWRVIRIWEHEPTEKAIKKIQYRLAEMEQREDARNKRR